MNQTTLQHLIDELKEVHLDGIEAIYSTYTTGEEQYVKRLAKENGLLISGGSDSVSYTHLYDRRRLADVAESQRHRIDKQRKGKACQCCRQPE